MPFWLSRNKNKETGNIIVSTKTEVTKILTLLISLIIINIKTGEFLEMARCPESKLYQLFEELGYATNATNIPRSIRLRRGKSTGTRFRERIARISSCVTIKATGISW